MPITPCQPSVQNSSIEARTHTDNMRKIVNKWMNPKIYKNISKRFDGNYEAAERGIKEMVQEELDLPYSENFHFTDMQWKKVEDLSRVYNNRIGRNWSNFWNGFVPEYISFQDPVARKLERQFNSISQFEKHQVSSNAFAAKAMSQHLQEAYIAEGHSKGIIGVPIINKMRKLQKKILQSNNESDKLKFMEELNSIVQSDKGKVIRDFIDLSEMSNADFNQTSRLKQYVKYDSKGDPETVKVNKHLINSVKASRENFDRLGDVSIHTLNKINQVVDLKMDTMYGSKKGPQYDRFRKSLDSAIQRIKDQKAEGGYLPRYLMESVIDMKMDMDALQAAESTQKMLNKLDTMSEVLSSINTGRMADRFKARNEMLDNIYNTDPLYMVQQYGKEVASLNKLASYQETYLKAMKDLPNVEMKFVNNLKKFINEQYLVSTRGLTDRPKWVNDMTRAISGLQIARTMGLNLTGAIKNTSSIVYYMHQLGKRNFSKAKQLVKNDEKIQKAMSDIKKEQGFLFPDMTRELVTHGLLPAEGIHKSDINIDPLTGAITADGKDLTLTAEWANMGIDGLLYFHRVTENVVRNNIFETAFAHKYKQLLDTPEFVLQKTGKDGNPTPEFAEKSAKRFAKNFALNMVNQYAYEYAIHAKSRYVRGQEFNVDSRGNKVLVGNSKALGTLKGVAQQQAFQLMHYPMSLIGTHQHKLKGAIRDVNVGDYTGQNVQFWGRYASVAAILGLTSIGLNINLFGIVDHDMFGRINNLHNILLDDPDEEKTHFGLASVFTGPMVSHATFLANYTGLLNVDDNEWHEMMFGNIDYQDPDNEKYLWYQMGTFPGQMANKFIPTTKNGRGYDNIRHIFKMYPSGWTQQYNQQVFGRKPKMTRSRKSEDRLRQNALLALQGL